MAMKCERFSGPVTQALTVSTQTVGPAFDISHYVGFAATLTCPASAAGSMFLEWCAINSLIDADWSAVNTTVYPAATVTLAASSSKTVNAHGLHVGFVRVRVTLSAGAGSYVLNCLAKG